MNTTGPDLHIASTSPTVNAGINLGASAVGTVDFAGNPRVQGSNIDSQSVVPQKVSEAGTAVLARRRELFYREGTPEEKEALEDELYALRAFRNAQEHLEAA